jgi:hypothetical protein
MIIVTGTKRSGTSMWMQVLAAAGLPTLGEAFPRDWGRTIREANPEGFFESPLRNGIYYATNPNPKNGAYLAPAATRRTVVKVFVPGLVKTDLAYVDKVLCTVRSVREYAASLERLYAMERENKAEADRRAGRTPLPGIDHVPAWLEWWHDNYRLLSDVMMRRYPLHMISYASALANPEKVVAKALAWLGAERVDAAVARVREGLRTQHHDAEASSIPADAATAEVFDELYARVHEQRPLDGAFLAQLDATHEKLEPLISAAEARAKASRKRLRALREERKRRAAQ